MQDKGLKRNTTDKYYTNDNVVHLCLQDVKKHLNISNDDLIIEPSAGNGSFMPGIKTLSNNYKFYDLEPGNVEILKQDYLEYDYSAVKEKFKKIHVIGNPPFGRQSSLAIKFVKKSCEFCDSISFILPKSFKKDSLKRKIPLNFHIIFEKDLPNNSFIVNGVQHDVPCVFQIWEKKTKNRVLNKKIEPINFLFVKKNEDPDISYRRVGSNAGKIDTKIQEKNTQTHYFMKFTNKNSINDNISKLNSIKYDYNNTVGPKSISQQELIVQFNALLK